MASFLLTPCKIREGWLVPKKGEPSIEVNWPQLCERLAPTGSLPGRQTLRKAAAVGAYALLVRQSSGAVTNVVLRNPDLSGDIRGILKRDPTLEGRVLAAYRFEAVKWDDVVVEAAAIR